MRFLLVSLFAIFLSCDSTKTTDTIAEASLIPKAPSMKTLRSLTSGALDTVKAPTITKMPDFSKYIDVNKKKTAFFNFMRPMMVEENSKKEWERERLKVTFELLNTGETISPEDIDWVNDQAKSLKVYDFDISNADSRLELTKKIDIIPEAMFLAQAANESAWGTSRFARQANNIFGQWCFTPGCGIVPTQRAAGDIHEVQKFKTVNDAVTSYVHHINSNAAYVSLRDLRYAERKKGNLPSGTICAGGLQKYSARGEAYVKEIRNMIRTNKLEAL